MLPAGIQGLWGLVDQIFLSWCSMFVKWGFQGWESQVGRIMELSHMGSKEVLESSPILKQRMKTLIRIFVR